MGQIPKSSQCVGRRRLEVVLQVAGQAFAGIHGGAKVKILEDNAIGGSNVKSNVAAKVVANGAAGVLRGGISDGEGKSLTQRLLQIKSDRTMVEVDGCPVGIAQRIKVTEGFVAVVTHQRHLGIHPPHGPVAVHEPGVLGVLIRIPAAREQPGEIEPRVSLEVNFQRRIFNLDAMLYRLSTIHAFLHPIAQGSVETIAPAFIALNSPRERRPLRGVGR